MEGDANFAHAATLLHAELGPEHVLFSRTAGRLAGVIDFGDVSIGDQHCDLAFLTRRLGPGFIAIDDVFIGLDRDARRLVEPAVADLIEQIEADPRG